LFFLLPSGHSSKESLRDSRSLTIYVLSHPVRLKLSSAADQGFVKPPATLKGAKKGEKDEG
jgi:hypothetical protein